MTWLSQILKMETFQIDMNKNRSELDLEDSFNDIVADSINELCNLILHTQLVGLQICKSEIIVILTLTHASISRVVPKN